MVENFWKISKLNDPTIDQLEYSMEIALIGSSIVPRKWFFLDKQEKSNLADKCMTHGNTVSLRYGEVLSILRYWLNNLFNYWLVI